MAAGPDRWLVPSLAAIRAMTLDELQAAARECDQAIEHCEAALIEPLDEAHINRVRHALLMYRGGRTLIGNRVAMQTKKSLFERPRPVASYMSAITAMKSVNRLLGLLNDEHVAFRAWLEVDPEGDPEAESSAWARLEHASDLVEEALHAPAAESVRVVA